ncbi:MAG: polyphosphate kinase 1 [Baekduia sp.]
MSTHDTPLYENRELSWLDFNERVLELAEDKRQPLMERLKFAAIFTSNADEFFMIRVAGLFDQVDAGMTDPGPDGRTPSQVIDAIAGRFDSLLARQSRVVRNELLPALSEKGGIRLAALTDLTPEDRSALDERYYRQVFPVLTPLAVGVGRPFPYISNLSLSLAVIVRDPENGERTFARVKVPTEILPRFLAAADGGDTLVRLEDLIAANVGDLFPGMEVLEHGFFRVTRDADFEIADEADDLLAAVEDELRRRRFGEVVRVELQSGMSSALREMLVEALRVEQRQVHEVDGMLDCTCLWQLVKMGVPAELRDEPWTSVTQPRLRDDEGGKADMFAVIRRGDVLVHHPYDSFTTSVRRFVEQAASDEDVLAIKVTIYRTSDDSPFVPLLIRASERGKQAVALVEVKARFDERNNIEWARVLEETGVHVVHGTPGLKTHTKCILVVRREGDGVRHYVHIGTGNYHPSTARLYTDFGLFTCDEALGRDVADMFNSLTGGARPRTFQKALVAPRYLRDGILREIEETIAAKAAGEDVSIRMKMNALVDRPCIRALYRASQAGVPVKLNIRGICCLVPGVPGLSETIEVVSVVGRFLEHSRVFEFRRGDDERIYIGSADLMPRNLDTRVEFVAPVDDPALRRDLRMTLDLAFADETNAWDLGADGSWTRREGTRSLHRELMEYYRHRETS